MKSKDFVHEQVDDFIEAWHDDKGSWSITMLMGPGKDKKKPELKQKS